MNNKLVYLIGQSNIKNFIAIAYYD